MPQRKSQRTIDREKLKLQQKMARDGRDATPEAIAERERIKQEIQSEWSEYERQRHQVHQVRHVEVRTVSHSGECSSIDFS